jgi:hypothetical protein
MMYIKETYPATVTKNDDDEERGRIKVSCVGILGDDESELPMWVEPLLDWGWFYIPDNGEIVDIEVISSSELDESYQQASIDNLDIKWKGKRYYGNENGDEPTTIHDYFKENYGKRRGFATPFGHVMIFDDTEGSQKLILSWAKEKQATEDENISQLIIDSDGTVKLSVLGKNSIHIKENEVEILLNEGASVKLTDKDADAIMEVGDGSVAVAIADHLETFYASLKAHIDATTIPTAMGPSSPIGSGSEGPLPTWESKINSTHVKIPDEV